MRKLVLGLGVGAGIAVAARRVLGRVGVGGRNGSSTEPWRPEPGPDTAGLPDDPTIAHRVETELFRDESVPKGQINVNAQGGVVQLRGEVPSEEMLNALVERARGVEGVREVESLLHLPGAEAPMHE
jgi:osmotically-inducible protein OsmY